MMRDMTCTIDPKRRGATLQHTNCIAQSSKSRSADTIARACSRMCHNNKTMELMCASTRPWSRCVPAQDHGVDVCQHKTMKRICVAGWYFLSFRVLWHTMPYALRPSVKGKRLNPPERVPSIQVDCFNHLNQTTKARDFGLQRVHLRQGHFPKRHSVVVSEVTTGLPGAVHPLESLATVSEGRDEQVYGL